MWLLSLNISSLNCVIFSISKFHQVRAVNKSVGLLLGLPWSSTVAKAQRPKIDTLIIFRNMIICLINFQVTEIIWKRRPSLPTIVISFVEMGTSYELYVKCRQNITNKEHIRLKVLESMLFLILFVKLNWRVLCL